MEDGRRPKRTTRFSGDFQKFDAKDSDDDFEEDDAPKRPKAPKPAAAKVGGKRTKQCPGCGANVGMSLRECPNCDNQFSSKSVLVAHQSAIDESQTIRANFPFEPEREDDGSLIIQAFLGRRIRKEGRRSKSTELALLSAMDTKYDYEYLLKFKSMSYQHAQWMHAVDIEAMGNKAQQALNRYLGKIDRGDPTVQVDGEIDLSYLEIDRILDCKEEEVVEVVDELPPAAPVESAEATTSRLAAAIQESNKEEDRQVTPAEQHKSSGTNDYAAAVIGEDGEEIAKSASQIFQGGERCRQVLLRIMEDSYAVGFIEPVDTETYDDYLDVVGESICLNDIKERMDAGEYSKYGQHKKFLTDVRLVWKNCKMYNMYKSQIWHCAHYMSMMFERLYQAWVLSFSNGAIPLQDPIARPWEPFCRTCGTDDEEDKVILCDHCDASYHIYCLRPPLKSIPEGIWICDHCTHWIARTNGRLMSAAAEEEARLAVESAGTRKYIRVKKKKYLVKWRGLSYRDCTWETAADINDDEKVAFFHKVNEALPDEPPLTQAEIAMELDKDKKFQLLPAMYYSSLPTDVYATVVAQIRSMHFLKWNKVPTECLLKESGPTTLGWVYGSRAPMVISAALDKAIKSSNDAMETDEPVKMSQTWLHPPITDEHLGEVANVLSEIVYSVARGDSMPPRPELPSNHILVRIVVNTSPRELFMNIGNYNGKCVVAGFKRMSNGTPGPVERTNRVKVGDVIAAINGTYVADWTLERITALLKRDLANPILHLRLIRVFGAQTAKNVAPHLLCFAEEHIGRAPPTRRSLYFGVFPSSAPGKWLAESYYNYTRNTIAEFDIEEQAAKAYDSFIRSKIQSGEAPAASHINFNEDGTLTATAAALSKEVTAERELAAERLELLETVQPENDMESLDTLDADTDISESIATDSDGEEDANSSASEYEYDDNKGDWKPKEAIEATGPISRLLKAVCESEQPPAKSDWVNYVLDMGMSKHMSNGQVVLIEQMDGNSGETIKLWDSIPAAARALGIPLHEIIAAIKNRNDGASAGGFRWRTLKSATDVEEAAEEVAEDSWKQKLYKTSREYSSGGTLRDYQVEGLNWLLRCWYNKRSSILADEMGLGKTVQVITFLEHLFREENIKGPFLVCVPLSTIEHWRREAEGWTAMTVCIYHDIGGGRDMRDVIREFEWYYKGRSRRLLKFHILVTTYDDLIKDYEELAEVPWRVVVVDEAHRLRNTNSKLLECMRSTVAKGLAMHGYQHRILMTGTPLQNNTAELWSLLNFIEPAKFPDAEKFAERFGQIQTQEQVEALQRRISPHILRRVKEDVAKDIPPKEETIIDVELTTMQKQYYRAIFEHNHGFLSQGFKGGNMPKLMNIQMELRKICNHPFLITGVEEKEMEALDTAVQSESIAERKKGHNFDAHAYKKKRIEDFLIQTSGKMVLIDKLLPKLKAEGHKVLIFSQMVKMIDLIDEFCEFRRYSCERLDGRVSGNDRQKSIDRFNKDPNSFVFLLSTRAGGVGINLTAADTVIIFDSDWNPQNDVQAMARCHRIGQLKSVTIYRLITRKSFEAEMFERASKKLGLEQAVLGSRQFDAEEYEESQKQNAKMDAKELEQLLREGAYAVLLEDNTEDMKTFCEQDIESILDQRSHVIKEDKSAGGEVAQKQKHRARKSIFTGGSATEFAEVDVNDPDFWKKVLPDLVTPDTMLQRLSDHDFDADEDDEDDDYNSRQIVIKKYINDLSKMMEGILDLQRRGQLPERERGVCMKLLLQITLKEDVFDYHQRSATQEWLTVLEGTRNRRRVDVDKYQPLPIHEAAKTTKRLSIKAAAPGKPEKAAGGARKRRRMDDDDDDDDDEVDEDDLEEYTDKRKPSSKGKKGPAKKVPKEEPVAAPVAAPTQRKRRPRSDIGTRRKPKTGAPEVEVPEKVPEKAEKKARGRGSKVVYKDDEDISEDEFKAAKKQTKPRRSSTAPQQTVAVVDAKKRILQGRVSKAASDDSDNNDADSDSDDLFGDDEPYR